LLREARPKQWVKNVLLLAAPGAAGVLTHPHTLARVLLEVVAFCLTASGVYYLNDVVDVEADRQHPTKRNRPIAAGIVPVRLGTTVGVLLFVAGALTALLGGWRQLVVLLVYVVITTSYSFRFKHVPVVDLVLVAAGFLIRAVAGGVAAAVPLSPLFLLVAAFGSLFMVAGKRHGEWMEMGEERAATRASLRAYSDGYLRYVWSIASAVTMVGYSLWAFQLAQGRHQPLWYELSVAPFVVALLRYAYLVEGGQGGEPEEVVLGDRQLQLLGLVWALLFATAVYFD
jgi:decaprenyl-phosphate phosphoribosyltransferase